jgi:glycosyltransferase involved in cell wall biosynthesis
MKIGYDGKRAANNFTGLGNYSRTLITQLASLFPTHQYFVYTEKTKHSPQINSFFSQQSVYLRLKAKSLTKFFWRSIGIKKQLISDNLDLYHGLSYELPIGIKKLPIKTVVTIHDLIYLRYPEYYKFVDRKIYDWKSRYACENSTRIVAISERTKNDLIELYKVDEAKIDVIYQSCDDSFKSPKSEELTSAVLKKYNLPSKFLLIVGTIEPRKNLLLAVNALKDVNQDYKLVVIGKKLAYAKLVLKQIHKLNLTNRVIFLEGLPFADLPPIYQMASAFVYPSFYEGFGIPIIEALYSKIPVIAATGSCLEEAGGPDSIYIDPNNANDFAVQINNVLNNPALKLKMIEKGRQYVRKFDNQLLAQQMMNCYKKTLETKEQL